MYLGLTPQRVRNVTKSAKTDVRSLPDSDPGSVPNQPAPPPALTPRMRPELGRSKMRNCIFVEVISARVRHVPKQTKTDVRIRLILKRVFQGARGKFPGGMWGRPWASGGGGGFEEVKPPRPLNWKVRCPSQECVNEMLGSSITIFRF